MTSSVCSWMSMFFTTLRAAVSMTCTFCESGLSTRSQLCGSSAHADSANKASRTELARKFGSQAADQLHQVLDVALVVLVVQEAGAERCLPPHARRRHVRLAALAHRLRNPVVERIEGRIVEPPARRTVAEIHDRQR